MTELGPESSDQGRERRSLRVTALCSAFPCLRSGVHSQTGAKDHGPGASQNQNQNQNLPPPTPCGAFGQRSVGGVVGVQNRGFRLPRAKHQEIFIPWACFVMFTWMTCNLSGTASDVGAGGSCGVVKGQDLF